MESPTAHATSQSVGFLLIDGFALMSYAAAVEPLRAANLLSGHAHYTFINLAVAGDAAVSSSGAAVTATSLPHAPETLDMIFVVAGGNPFAFRGQETLQWLRRQSRRGAILGGISGGPVILAMADALTGYRVSIHWEHLDAMAEHYPALALERAIYAIDRDRMTCAGGTAPIDMMHALIVARHGPGLARAVSDWFIHTDVRPSGGAQRAGYTERYQTNNATVISAIEMIATHISGTLSLDQLAALSGVGARQLNRLFQQHLGISTMAFYRKFRLEKARDLLAQTTMPVTEVALATGFGNPAHFATAFRAQFGQPPKTWRAADRPVMS